MIGILYYIYFLILGFLYSKYIFNKNIYFHIWIGGVIGNVLLMIGIILPSFVFGFTIISHIILFILATIPLLILIKKKGLPKFNIKTTKKDEMNGKIFAFLIIPIFLLIAILLTNHILVPVNSGVASGQSTYGDLNMHLGFVTGISEQKVFPPNYIFLAGTKLNYPFLVDSLSSSLYSMGTSLRVSVLIPSYAICLFLIMGFYYLAYKITENRRAAILATIFFFIGGGLGFIYYFDGAKENIASITRIFTEFYQTPTNNPTYNLNWVNPICDMIIPQRTTMAGWFMIMPCLWFLIDGFKTNSRKSFIILGLLASSLPMIHTHSFMALGIISIGMLIFSLIRSKEKKKVFWNWFIYGGIVLLIGFPQLFIWTFKQTAGNENFVRFHFNWANSKDPYLWYYIKNWGLTAIFAVPAFLYANRDNRKLYISSLLLLVIAELFVFQPNTYDNNKLIFIVYMVILINCCNWYINIFDKLKKVAGRYFIIGLIIILSTLSGILTIIREMNSGGEYLTFNDDMLKMGGYIRENTDSDKLFLTSTTHINTVATLSGRNVYVGSSIYVYFHGFGELFSERENETKKIYSSSYDELIKLCRERDIDYIYLGIYEKGSLTINWKTFDKLEKVVSFGEESLYKVS